MLWNYKAYENTKHIMVPAAKPNVLSSTPGTNNGGRKELTPESCPLIFDPCALECAFTQYMHNRNFNIIIKF